jgi:hypothetical protein
MRKLLFASLALMMVLTACQKEPSFEDPNSIPGNGGSGGSNGTKLVRMGTRAGTDSLTTEYVYDASNRLILMNNTGTVNGQAIALQQIIRRNAAGIITSTVLKSSLFLAAGFATDSLVTIHEYDGAKGQYVRSVLHYVLDNEPLADSAVYGYDANGKLTTLFTYIGDSTGYAPDTKTEYTYAGNNLASAKGYSFDGSSFTLDETQTFEYDNKINPMQSLADAPILGISDFYPANNKTKRTTVTVDPPETVETNVVYTYNSNNRPTRADGSAAGATSTISYYYQ